MIFNVCGLYIFYIFLAELPGRPAVGKNVFLLSENNKKTFWINLHYFNVMEMFQNLQGRLTLLFQCIINATK